RGTRRAGPGRESNPAAPAFFVATGRVLAGIAAIFYGVETFLHPLGMPGIPLEKLMSEWIPARPLIGYLTAAILVAGGATIFVGKKTGVGAHFFAHLFC